MSKFLSRKFIVAALTVALLLANGHYADAMYVALAYLGVQGAIDHKTSAPAASQSGDDLPTAP